METGATNGCLSDDDDSYVESPRVLSIQSHVVSGYVGNKSAVFPLQVVDVTVLDHFPLRKNKVGYTATQVACGWAGAIFEVIRPFKQEQ